MKKFLNEDRYVENHKYQKISDVSQKLKIRVNSLNPIKFGKGKKTIHNRCYGFGFLKVDGKEIY